MARFTTRRVNNTAVQPLIPLGLTQVALLYHRKPLACALRTFRVLRVYPLMERVISPKLRKSCVKRKIFYEPSMLEKKSLKFIIGTAALFLFTVSSILSQENIRIPQKQIRARVVSANGTPLTKAHILVRVRHKDLDGSSGWGNSPDTKQTDAEGFFLADLRLDDEPQIYILGVEYRGYLTKTDPFIIHEEQLQTPFLLTLNGDPTQGVGQTSDQAYAALERLFHPPAVWVVNPTNGHAYKRIYCEDIIDAIAQAAVENAYVVALNNRAEEEWIRDAFMQHDLFWIGLSDAVEEGKWSWHSREPLEYINWEERYHAAEGGNTEMKDYAIVGFTGRWEAVGVDSDGETYTAFLERDDLAVKTPSATEIEMNVQAIHHLADPIC